MLDTLWIDARSAARSLRRYPIAALVAIVSLGGGIGATTITLTMRDTIFRNPPPLYENPEELSLVGAGTPERPRGRVPGTVFAAWQQDTTIGPRVAAATPDAARNVRVADRDRIMNVRAATPQLFSLLGVVPLAGADLASTRVAAPPAVISFRVWHELFDGRPDAVGSTLWIDDVPYHVAGVMPVRFWFSSIGTGVWTRLDTRALTAGLQLDVVARRPAAMTATALEQRLQTIAAPYVAALPADQQQLRTQVRGIGGTPIGNAIGPIPVVLMGLSVLLTLLIACTNVAILMIAQWTAREQEIAIRASIGASRGRIVRALVSESLSIAVAGAVLGMGLTLAIRNLIVANVAGSALFDLLIKPAVFIQSTAIALLAGLLTGLAPALYETRRSQSNPLSGLRTSDRVGQRWRHVLVAFEIAVTVALLVVAGTLVSAYRKSLADDMGYDTSPLLTVRVENSEGMRVDAMRDAIAGVAGVESVAPATAIPMGAPARRQAVSRPGSDALIADGADVAHNFFATIGVPVRAGRSFQPTDTVSDRVVMLNDRLAAQLFGDRPAVGEQVLIDGATYDVVGVTASYSTVPLSPPRPMFFIPFEAGSGPSAPTRVSFLVRTNGPPALVRLPVRDAIRALPGNDVVTQISAIDEIINVGAQEILVTTVPMMPLIAIGLLLTAAGIYGVLAFAVARRARELAVRIAVGATGRDLASLVMSYSLKLVSIGVGSAIAVTYGLTRLAQGAGGIFDSPEMGAFVVPMVIVFAVAMIATWIPARRAMKIDPVALLRST